MMVKVGTFKVRQVGKGGLSIGIPAVLRDLFKIEIAEELEWFRDTDHPDRMILAKEGEIVDPAELFK